MLAIDIILLGLTQYFQMCIPLVFGGLKVEIDVSICLSNLCFILVHFIYTYYIFVMKELNLQGNTICHTYFAESKIKSYNVEAWNSSSCSNSI